MTPFFTLLRHESGLLLRGGWNTVAVVGFTLLVSVVSSFAFRFPGISPEQLRAVFTGALWIIFLFSGTILLSHSWQMERENSAHWGVWLATGAGTQLFFAKLVVGVVALTALGVLAAGTLAVFFSYGLSGAFGGLCALLAICSLGFVAIGTLLSALAASVREREVILPLLFYPLLLIMLAQAVTLTTGVLEGRPLRLDFPFVFLVAFDVISVAVSYLLFQYVITE